MNALYTIPAHRDIVHKRKEDTMWADRKAP